MGREMMLRSWEVGAGWLIPVVDVRVGGRSRERGRVKKLLIYCPGIEY